MAACKCLQGLKGCAGPYAPTGLFVCYECAEQHDEHLHSDCPCDDCVKERQEGRVMICIVNYVIGTYSGSITVNAAPDEDDDQVIARAKKRLIPFPVGLISQRFTVVRQEEGSEG